MAVVETVIPHPMVGFVGQSQGCDLLNNGLGSLGKVNPSFLEVDFHFCGDSVEHLIEDHVELGSDLSSPQILD